MDTNDNNVVEMTATEKTNEETKNSKFTKINQIWKNRRVQVAAAALITAGVVAKIVVAARSHTEETTEEV